MPSRSAPPPGWPPHRSWPPVRHGQPGPLPANLLAAPAVAPATVLGMLAAVVAPWCGRPATSSSGRRLAGPVAGAGRRARRPAARCARPWPAGLVGAGLLAGSWLRRWALGVPRLRPLGAGRLRAGAGRLAVRQAVRGWPPPGTVVVACDVGQGDALVLPTGPREAVLVDAGPDVLAVDRCLDRPRHRPAAAGGPVPPGRHHVGGLAGALGGRKSGWWPSGRCPRPTTGCLSSTHSSPGGCRRIRLVPGDRRDVGRWRWRCSHPIPSRRPRPPRPTTCPSWCGPPCAGPGAAHRRPRRGGRGPAAERAGPTCGPTSQGAAPRQRGRRSRVPRRQPVPGSRSSPSAPTTPTAIPAGTLLEDWPCTA